MILAVDTSGAKGQLFLQSKKDLFQSSWQKQGSHSEIITKEFIKLLEMSKGSLEELKKIFVINGPGSFTGLRVGINFSKTLAYSISAEVFPVNTLWALALSHRENDGEILSLVDAQRNSVFASSYSLEDGKIVGKKFENRIIDIDDLSDVLQEDQLVCGPGWTRYSESIRNREKYNFFQDDIDFKKIFTNQTFDNLSSLHWQDLRPLYIRKSAAEEKRDLQ